MVNMFASPKYWRSNHYNHYSPYISAGQARTAMMLCSTQSTSAPRGSGTIFMSNPAHLHKKNWNCQARSGHKKPCEKGEIIPTRLMIRNGQVYFCWWVSCHLFLLWLVFNGTHTDDAGRKATNDLSWIFVPTNNRYMYTYLTLMGAFYCLAMKTH